MPRMIYIKKKTKPKGKKKVTKKKPMSKKPMSKKKKGGIMKYED